MSRGSIKERVGRHPVIRTKMAVVSSGKEAHTDWEVVQRYAAHAAKINCVIHTGRTHQIRVHLSSIKYPLLGDSTYGFKVNRLKGISVPRVMLHSTELRILHPDTGKQVTFEAPLPADFSDLVEALHD